MAPLNASLAVAFSRMAEGCQRDPSTVKAAVAPILRSYETLPALRDMDASQLAAYEPSLRDLLQAAGWLYPCILPSSSLPSAVQQAAHQAWRYCVCFSYSILDVGQYTITHKKAIMSMLEPRSQPQVPGEAGLCLHLFAT
jgi:hypothetical protein